MNTPTRYHDALCIGPSSFTRYLAGGPPPDPHGLTRDNIHEIQRAVYADDVGSICREHHHHLSDHDARISAAQRFRTRLHFAQKDRRLEDANDPEYTTNTFTIIDTGDIYYLRDDVTLEMLHLRQRDITPKYYSSTDHQVSRLVMEAFQNGATRVVAYYGEGRDLIEMTYDPVSNIGKTCVINTEKIDGKLHTTEEMKEIVGQRFLGANEVTPSPETFLMSDVKLEHNQIQHAVSDIHPTAATFRIANSESDRKKIHHERPSDTKRNHSNGQKTDEKLYRTSSDEKINRSLIISDTVLRPLETVGTALWTSGKNVARDVSTSAVALSGFLYTRYRENAKKKTARTVMENRSAPSVWQKVTELFQKKTGADSIREVGGKTKEAITARQFAPVVQGALVMSILSVLTGERFGLVTLVRKREVRPGHRKNRHRIQKEGIRVFTAKEIKRKKFVRRMEGKKYVQMEGLKIERLRKSERTRLRRKKHKGTEQQFRMYGKEKMRAKRGLMQEFARLLRPEQKKKSTEKRLFTILIRLGRILSVHAKNVRMRRPKARMGIDQMIKEASRKVPVRKRKTGEQNEVLIIQKEHTARFLFVSIIWLLVNDRVRYGKLNQIDLTAHTRVEPLYVEYQRALNETLLKHEGTQWILLSIICYLAAIRESCTTGSRSAKHGKQHATRKKKNTMKQQNFYFPNSGVVFAFTPMSSSS